MSFRIDTPEYSRRGGVVGVGKTQAPASIGNAGGVSVLTLCTVAYEFSTTYCVAVLILGLIGLSSHIVGKGWGFNKGQFREIYVKANY